MKKLLLILLTYLLILTCSNSGTVKLPDKNLEIKDSIVYYKNTPYTGIVSGTDLNNNSARFKAEVKNGFLVSKERKELWGVELDLLWQFKNICDKYKITYDVTYIDNQNIFTYTFLFSE